MSHRSLKFVRHDHQFDFDVYTEHPDSINPRDLSNILLYKYGKDRFMFALRRNVYIIYIKPKMNDVSAPVDMDSSSMQRLEEIRLAREKLMG